MEFHKKLTPATQSSRVLIRQSNMISPLGVFTTMLLNLLLEIVFPHESLHVREKRFAPAKGQNLAGHRVWTCSSLFTWCTVTCSLPFFVAGIIPELPWINLLMSMMSYIPFLSLVIWHDTPESPIKVFFVNEKKCYHWWYTSYQPQRAV